MFGDKGEIEQLHHRFLVQVRVKGESYSSMVSWGWAVPQFHGGMDSFLLFGGDFLFQQMIKKGEIGTLVGFLFLGDSV